MPPSIRRRRSWKSGTVKLLVRIALFLLTIIQGLSSSSSSSPILLTV